MILGLKDIGELAGAMKKAKEAKARFEQARKELGDLVVQASSPCGGATATVNGDGIAIDLKIEKSLVEGGDAEQVGSVALSAVVAAQMQAQSVKSERMARIARDMGLPENLDLPV